MGFQFGSFNNLCEKSSLIVCPLLGTGQGLEPVCYSRNIDLGGTVIFQPSTCFIHIVAIFMTGIMILHIRSKYTAIGRKEVLLFFYLYAVIEFFAIFLDSEIIPTASTVYPWFAAIYTGLVAAAYCCLLINGFVGFQFAEDGTPMSLWLLRLSCLAVFGIGFFISIATFKSYVSFSPAKPTGLWIIYILWPIITVLIYVISQLVLVFRTLEDRWPIGDIVFGTAFFVVAQAIAFGFSQTICNAVDHYIDGLFFFTLCILLSVMMVYKYWDSITKEDLEFSVGNKAAVWEVKDPLLANADAAGPDFEDEYPYQAPRSGAYGRAPPSLVGGYNGQQLYNQSSYSKGYPPSSSSERS